LRLKPTAESFAEFHFERVVPQSALPHRALDVAYQGVHERIIAGAV
jgi:hypothetical protein